MEEKINSAFHQLGLLGLSKAECQVKTHSSNKEEKEKAVSGREPFLSILCQGGKAGLVILFGSPGEILNMIGKKSGITR